MCVPPQACESTTANGQVTYTALHESCHNNSSTDTRNCERFWFAAYQIFSWVELHVFFKEVIAPLAPVALLHPNSTVNHPATKENLCLTVIPKLCFTDKIL